MFTFMLANDDAYSRNCYYDYYPK